jgi:hypothetical protein
MAWQRIGESPEKYTATIMAGGKKYTGAEIDVLHVG